MRHASVKFRRRSVPNPTAVAESTCRFLRERHPARTADNVAADLAGWGVKSATVAKMLERQSTPSTYLWLALTCVYGPELLCAVLPTPPAWLDVAQRADRQRELAERIATMQAELEALARGDAP